MFLPVWHVMPSPVIRPSIRRGRVNCFIGCLGIVKLGSELKHWFHEERAVSLLRSSFPPEIISYAVWVYHRFCLSFRDVEDLLAERGIIVSYEAIRLWCQK